VEHPVTELVTGIDLVEWQLRVASGERLPFTQESIVPRGWAIECRITSEDPDNGFLPSTGRVDYLHVPGGPGVRWDSGIEAGSEIGLHYDPMLAKLIVWAPDRERAVERMRRALLELTVHGIETSRDFHLRVMEDDEFRRGAIEIQWLERRLPVLVGTAPPDDGIRTAAIAAAVLAHRDRSGSPAASATRRESGATGTTATTQANGAAQDGWKHAARCEAVSDR
jgi:acetyl-CoA carboxylase biotin carboxylase subunit